MRTFDELRQIYVATREAAKIGSPVKVQTVLNGLKQFSEHFKELYDAKESVVDRAKCRNSFESMDSLADIVNSCGLNDERVKAFFGFAEAKAGAPSFAQVIKGDDSGRVKPVSPSKKEKDKDADDSPVARAKSKEKAVETAPSPAKIRPDEELMPPISVVGFGSFEPQSFAEFIGQEHVVKRICMEIKAAKIQGLKHIDHILLFGNRGLGKSTLMKLIAKELGVKFEFLDASQFGNDVRSQRAVQKFLQRISQANEPVVIAIDEIHALPKHIQTGLLTLLNDRVYSYLDEAGVTHNLPIADFTFIGATTDAQDILPTLKDRCNNLTFYLKDYTRDELSRIFVNKFAVRGLNIGGNELSDCINRCRSSIREVDAIVNGLYSRAIVAGVDTVDKEMLDEYFNDIDRDPMGLRAKDLEILQAIKSELSGVMSEETLAARVHLDPKILTKEFEPYLIKIGFISITPRGRSLTDKGIAYISDTKAEAAEEGENADPVTPPKSEPAPDAPIDPMDDMLSGD